MHHRDAIKIMSLLIAVCFTTLMFYSLLPDAEAVHLEPGIPSTTTALLNHNVIFNDVSVKIEGYEKLPIVYCNFSIHNSNNDNLVEYVTFTTYGAEISDPNNHFTVPNLQIEEELYDIGYLNGTDETDQQDYSFGYGYGYGYGSDQDSQYNYTLTYDITYKATQQGTYYAVFSVNVSNEHNTHTFTSSNSGDFTITQTTSPPGPTNMPPNADAGGPYTALLNETISFDGSQSTDLDGSIVTYYWNFGDGYTEMGVSPIHYYANVGTYTVILTVTDDKGATDTDTTTAHITKETIQSTNKTKTEIQNITNVTVEEPFYIEDSDDDGILDTFIDPNDLFDDIRITDVDEHQNVLIMVNLDIDDLFLWDSVDGDVEDVLHSYGTITNTEEIEETNTINVTVEIEKSEWTYFELDDPHPQLEHLTVTTSDGRIIPDHWIWRENGKIYVLDDPDTTYHLIYQRFLFDVEVLLTKDTIEPGESQVALIELLNVGAPGLVEAHLEYLLIKDGETIWTDTQELTVTGQLAYNISLPTDSLQDGTYTFKVIHHYGEDQSAEASDTFIVKTTFNILWIILLLILILLISTFYLIAYYLHKKGYIEIEEEIESPKHVEHKKTLLEKSNETKKKKQ